MRCNKVSKINKVYIIAEAGVNHNGSLKMAKKLIDEAILSGVDAVKFQTFIAKNEISCYAPKAEYQLDNTENNESQLEMVRKLELTEEQHYILRDHCLAKGIDFISTPFDLESADLLVNKLNIDCIKISSGDITCAPLLLVIAKSRKQVILSTGMSTLAEIEQALGVLAFGYLGWQEKPSKELFQQAYCCDEGQKILKEKVQLLHCTTEYPAPFEDVNLRVMDTLRHAFSLPVGFSDHTQGISVPIAAVAMGACIIEKHFTLDKNLPGPDHKASLEPDELTTMVQGIRQVELSMGKNVKIPVLSELKNKPIARKSLVARFPIKAGEIFTEQNLTFKRPGDGISPMEYWNIVGTKAIRDYQEDEGI